jgi:hypothetical protein
VTSNEHAGKRQKTKRSFEDAVEEQQKTPNAERPTSNVETKA